MLARMWSTMVTLGLWLSEDTLMKFRVDSHSCWWTVRILPPLWMVKQLLTLLVSMCLLAWRVVFLISSLLLLSIALVLVLQSCLILAPSKLPTKLLLNLWMFACLVVWTILFACNSALLLETVDKTSLGTEYNGITLLYSMVVERVSHTERLLFLHLKVQRDMMCKLSL